MEVSNKYQRLGEEISAFTGTIAGGAAGAVTGAKAGPMGALVGGLVGTAASAIGGMADISVQDKLRNEAMDYTKDLFGYRLGNIQALPNTISKVSSLNQNNKIFPILEYYTCTEEELNAFVNKVAYNGMTTMVIGNMEEYSGNSWSYNGIESKGYIKGQLIRYMDDGEDFHIINSISGELNKGVYIE